MRSGEGGSRLCPGTAVGRGFWVAPRPHSGELLPRATSGELQGGQPSGSLREPDLGTGTRWLSWTLCLLHQTLGFAGAQRLMLV